MDFLQHYGKEIFAITIPIMTWALNHFYKSKAKLKAANPHTFSFLIEEPIKNEDGEIIKPNQIAHTKSLLVKNVGRESATKVEVSLNWRPQYFNIWPPRYHTTQSQEDGRFYILFDSLSPGEAIAIELLSVNRDLPVVLNIRSEQSMAKFVQMEAMEVVHPRAIAILRLMVILGFSASIYLTIVLVQFLILKTS